MPNAQKRLKTVFKLLEQQDKFPLNKHYKPKKTGAMVEITYDHRDRLLNERDFIKARAYNRDFHFAMDKFKDVPGTVHFKLCKTGDINLCYHPVIDIDNQSIKKLVEDLINDFNILDYPPICALENQPIPSVDLDEV